MQSEVVAEQMEGEQKKRIEEIGYMGRSAIDKMRDIVWSLDTSKDKYENLMDRMHVHLESTIPNTRFSYTFNHVDIEKSKVLSPLLRQNLYLIFKEAVHNVVKHSDGDQLTISLEKKRSGIVLVIHDNGIFKGNQGTEGMGMRSMEKRAQKISAKFEVDTTQGTSIIITI